ncbi:MAG: heavy metal translocating P-type ATPase [Rhizobiaceae bacterium]|nr:heavy metal translocating P-type ATPase [Rhizobiaceae bacterium]
MSINSETLLRQFLLAVAVIGLAAGLAGQYLGLNLFGLQPSFIWAVATLPILATLAISIARDLFAGRVGVDAIALVSMSAALAMGQPLAGLVVAIMYAGGTVLEDFARGRAERSLTALTDRSPRTANRRTDSRVETVPVGEVKVGDELLVRAGELLPVDGLLIDETALIDEAAVTGEPVARKIQSGEQLRSGTINAGESFAMRATAIADQSTYAGIVRMVAAAQTVKAPFIRIADKFAAWMLPITLLVAGAAWYFSGDPVRALAVLVVATPCPLILAAPVAFISGVARAARSGALVKGSSSLEALANIHTAVFDKTGTLTTGGTNLVEIEAAPGREPAEMLRLLASLEQASHHVLAESIVAEARKRGDELSIPANVKEHRGSGLEGSVDGLHVRAGSRAMVQGADLPAWAQAGEQRYQGESVLRVFLSVDGELAAIFTFGDALRSDALDVLAELRASGISRIIMLTGDDATTAQRIAQAAGIENVIADASPEDKLRTINAEAEKAPTLMVGDGINDAPALASATVGVAMGVRGATASSQAADVVVLGHKLQPLADAIHIARRTRSIAWQSIAVGLGLSGVGMVAAALGYLPPIAGALFQEAIDIAVILNALRALAAPRRS